MKQRVGEHSLRDLLVTCVFFYCMLDELCEEKDFNLTDLNVTLCHLLKDNTSVCANCPGCPSTNFTKKPFATIFSCTIWKINFNQVWILPKADNKHLVFLCSLFSFFWLRLSVFAPVHTSCYSLLNVSHLTPTGGKQNQEIVPQNRIASGGFEHKVCSHWKSDKINYTQVCCWCTSAHSWKKM